MDKSSLSPFSRVAKNSIILFGAKIIDKVLGFAIAILLARYLGKADYGKYTFALSFVCLFFIFFDFGFNTLLTREVAKDRSKASYFFFNTVILQSILIFIGVGFISAFLFFFNYPVILIKMIYLFVMVSVLNSYANSFRAVFIAFEIMKYELLLIIFIKISTLIAVFTCIWLNAGLVKVVLASLLGAGVNLLLGSYFGMKYFIQIKLSTIKTEVWKGILKEACPFAITAVFVLIYFKIDSVMLFHLKGDVAVGIYNAAYNLIFVLVFIATSIGLAVFPAIARNFRKNTPWAVKVYKGSFKILLALGIPISVGIVLLADKIINLVYGYDFNMSVFALQVIIWTLPFMFITDLSGRILGAIDKQRVVCWIAGLGALVNIVLNLVLIPKFSYIGAALATVITEALIFTFQYRFLSKYLYRVPLVSLLIKMSFAAVVMGIGLLCLEDFFDVNLLVTVFISIVMYFTVLYRIKYFNLQELFLIKNLFFSSK